MRTDTIGLICALLLAGVCAASARADVVELANGSVMQGDFVAARTTADGLALGLYDTGGVVIVRWDHIEPSRRSELRTKFGIDLPERGAENVSGHRVLMANGRVAVGVALNPRGDGPLQMKTRSGLRTYERAALAGPVEDATIDAMQAYTEEEYFRLLVDANPPRDAAAHLALAKRCLNFGAFEHARDELVAARDDAGCSPDDRSVAESLLRRTAVLIRGKGAADLVKLVHEARFADRWNDAKSLVARIAAEYSDPQILEAIGYTALSARVEKGRDVHFQREVPAALHRALDAAIESKARERRPSGDAAAAGATVAGTLAAARQWENRELGAILRAKVTSELGLTADEYDTYWKGRTVKNFRRASYGAGTFIVSVKTPAPPPGGRRPGGAAPAQTKADAPPTAEEWWESAAASERASWLKADFAQTGGLFDVIRTNDANCRDCGGTGVTSSAAPDGSVAQHFCPRCLRAGVVRTVTYR